MNFYVNIDKPNNTATIHHSNCTHMGDRQKLLRDGQWHELKSYSEARQFADSTGRNVVECRFCNPQLA